MIYRKWLKNGGGAWLILGWGKSGKSAAQLLLSRGEKVLGIEDDPAVVVDPEIERLTDYHTIPWHTLKALVVSPGVPPQHPVYQMALQQPVEVIGELELALRYLQQQPLLAITGTNGKTSVTLLTTHVLNNAGIPARALGNVGEPLSSYALCPHPEEVLVLELSSFQIETLSSRVFDAAALLNITPDHLDRYPDMLSYAKTKCALQRYLKEGAPFFVQQEVVRQFGQWLTPPYQTFDGIDHESQNRAAAWALCQTRGVRPEPFAEALTSFRKPAHRIEFVCEIDGICYYDDSKGTNIDAVVHAVRAMKGQVILIVGGVDKGASYLPWTQAFPDKIKFILALGAAAPKIFSELHPYFQIEIVDSLEMAVDRAHQKATQTDCVLLSPGCSSYDMFRDYKHRGEEFQRCVHNKRRESL